MPDISHLYGQDLSVTGTGDIALSVGTQLGQEKIIRRLITVPGDDINHLDEGAGLAQDVGSPIFADQIRAKILYQMRKETYVSQTDPVNITITEPSGGFCNVHITYVDANTGQTSLLTVPYASSNQIIY